MNTFFGDGLKGIIEFSLSEVVTLRRPDAATARICELICGRTRMGFYHVPEGLAQMRPVMPSMFADFLPAQYHWQGTITGDLLPYIEQAMRPPGGLSMPEAVQQVVGIFGSLKLLECHRLNSELMGLAHMLDSVRSEVEKHVLIAPTVYQLDDFVHQYQVVASVAQALISRTLPG